MRTASTTAARFRVGDWVTFLYGPGNVFAQVIEDRGPLGVNRRRLYGVRLDRGAEEPDFIEIPEDDLEAASPPNTEAVFRYFAQGGLVSILRANLSGGRNQPRAWLTFTPRGDLAHTFTQESGVVGGAKVPFFALHEDKVFAGKRDEVVAFLTSFGLSRREAEEVVSSVGTAP
jgi:hypothetical protein